jgi:hypothetical protein
MSRANAFVGVPESKLMKLTPMILSDRFPTEIEIAIRYHKEDGPLVGPKAFQEIL